MKLTDWIKNKVYKLLGLQRLKGNPDNGRLTYINDDEAIQVEKIHSYKVWYLGDGDELLNYYTNQQTYGWTSNPIYNRNKRNYFWGLSSTECDIKRIHVDLARSIVDNMSAIVGKPQIQCNDHRLKKILEVNNFSFRLTQEVRPETLVQGDGCWKINFNKLISDVPLFEYYEYEDWNPIVKSGITVGALFKSYYRDRKNNNYVLIESRSLCNEGCLIEYNLYKLEKNNELNKVDFECIPELASLKNEPKLLIPIKKLFAIPNKYYYDPLRKDRGRSIYEGKLDLFDFLDEVESQASQTNRVSTPVEYYDTSILERTRDGLPILPNKYNRQFIMKNGSMDGNGATKGDGIMTTQPELNFDKYQILIEAIRNTILIGYMSPASMGTDIAKKDNAEAQREKEKQTLFTRDNIIDCESKTNIELCKQALLMQDYIDTGMINDIEYEVSIDYGEWANPSFESLLETLGPAWSNGQISTDSYTKLLWAGRKTEEERLKEMEELEKNKQADNLDMEQLLNGTTNTNKQDLPAEGQLQESAPKDKE